MILHILPGDLADRLRELLRKPEYAQKMREEALDLAAMKTLILHCLPRDFRARVITAITNIRRKPRETLRAFRERLLGLQSIATHLGVGFSPAQLWSLVQESGMTEYEATHFSASAGPSIVSDTPETGEQAAVRLGGLLNRWNPFASEGFFAENAAPGQPATPRPPPEMAREGRRSGGPANFGGASSSSNRAGAPASPGAAHPRGRSQSQNRGRSAAAAMAQGRRSSLSPPPASAAAEVDGPGSGSDGEAASDDGFAAAASGDSPSLRFQYRTAASPEEDLAEWQRCCAANPCCLCLHLQFATNGSPFKRGSCPYHDGCGQGAQTRIHRNTSLVVHPGPLAEWQAHLTGRVGLRGPLSPSPSSCQAPAPPRGLRPAVSAPCWGARTPSWPERLGPSEQVYSQNGLF